MAALYPEMLYVVLYVYGYCTRLVKWKWMLSVNGPTSQVANTSRVWATDTATSYLSIFTLPYPSIFTMTCLCASCITTPSCIANAMQLVCTNCALGDKCIQTTIGCQMPADATSKGKQHALETKMKENSNFLSALGVMVVTKKGNSFVSAKDLTN